MAVDEYPDEAVIDKPFLLFSTRMAIAEALREAGIDLPWIPDGKGSVLDSAQSALARKFWHALVVRGYEVVRHEGVGVSDEP